MNMILLFENDFVGGNCCVRLRGRRHRHVREVCRASVGDSLCVGLRGGLVGTGRIVSLNDEVLELDVDLAKSPPPELPVTLALALPRPVVLKRILASVSAMGVKRIWLFHSQRVEKSFWKSAALVQGCLDEQLSLGLEQARDTILPEVQKRQSFKRFVKNELAHAAKNTIALVAHPQQSNVYPCTDGLPVTLVVGPEGGFLPHEIDMMKDVGFKAVGLGERILRVETAVTALLAKLF